jgi:hypothetical protein
VDADFLDHWSPPSTYPLGYLLLLRGGGENSRGAAAETLGARNIIEIWTSTACIAWTDQGRWRRPEGPPSTDGRYMHVCARQRPAEFRRTLIRVLIGPAVFLASMPVAQWQPLHAELAWLLPLPNGVEASKP